MGGGLGVGGTVRHNTHEISKSRHKIFTDLPVAMKELSGQLLRTHSGFPRSLILPQAPCPALGPLVLSQGPLPSLPCPAPGPPCPDQGPSVLPQAPMSCPRNPLSCPRPPDLEPGLGADGRSSLIFSNYLLQQDRYLPKTFLKRKPVKICFQNNSASIIDSKQ